LTLNPNLVEAYAFIGAGKMFLARAEETEAHIQEAMRLSPRDEGAHRWMNWIGLSRLLLRADAEAVVWFRRGLNGNPNYPLAHFELAAALAHLGQLDEAQVSTKKGLVLDPSFTVRRFKSTPFSDNPTFFSRARQTHHSGDAHGGSAGGVTPAQSRMLALTTS
jgi:tetratricopeptide (TPR) repeat protein